MKKKTSDMSVKELEEEVHRHNVLYFEKNAPEISDYEFDRIVKRLKKLKPASPVLIELTSESQDQDRSFKKIRHHQPMLSLDKCYGDEDLLHWAKSFEGGVLVAPKIDGFATELRYNERGELVLGATRGDGFVGEDITANVRMVSDIPQKIPKGSLEIRGEIYMKLSEFQRYKDTFANPRNLAAGAIKQKDPKKTAEYHLSFLGYNILGAPLKTEHEKFDLLKKLHIPTVEYRYVAQKTPEALCETYNDFLSRREKWDFETDGVVYRADLVSEQERLGFTAHHPRFAIAYKFQGDSGTTTLRDVEWGVARTGVITPVGVVDPVSLSGATVTHVSLHNYGLMKKLGLRKGSKVVMMRRGGVIPNLESVSEAGRGAPFGAPKKCPSCRSPTEVRDDFLYCTNKTNCRHTKMYELDHFIKTIECDGFGEKLIEKLYDNGFVQDPADFYSLKKEDLLELERMGDVLATKLIGNIQTARKMPLEVFLRALGIREVAKHTSKLLARNYGTLNRILKLSEEELSQVHTIGPIIASEVVEGLKKKRSLIEKLLKQVAIENPPIPPLQKGGERGFPLQGKKFVFTGSLISMERGKAQKLVEEQGGEALDSVTSETDYLVVGDGGGAGSKLEKARKIQVKGGKIAILSESEWKKMMGP